MQIYQNTPLPLLSFKWSSVACSIMWLCGRTEMLKSFTWCQHVWVSNKWRELSLLVYNVGTLVIRYCDYHPVTHINICTLCTLTHILACAIREIFEKVCRSWDLGLSPSFVTFLYFCQLPVLTVFWAGLGWPGGQLMTDWLERWSCYLLWSSAGYDFRW